MSFWSAPSEECNCKSSTEAMKASLQVVQVQWPRYWPPSSLKHGMVKSTHTQCGSCIASVALCTFLHSQHHLKIKQNVVLTLLLLFLAFYAHLLSSSWNQTMDNNHVNSSLKWEVSTSSLFSYRRYNDVLRDIQSKVLACAWITRHRGRRSHSIQVAWKEFDMTF